MIKNLPVNVRDSRDVGLIPGTERSSGGGNSNPLQYSCLENSTDRRAWQAAVCGVAELDTTEHTGMLKCSLCPQMLTVQGKTGHICLYTYVYSSYT